MIARNNNFVLIGECFNEGSKFLEFFFAGDSGKISSMNEDVSLWPVSGLEMLLLVMGI